VLVPALDPQPGLAPLDILRLVGFAAGAALHLYLCGMLYQRYGWRRAQRVLLLLGFVIGLWHLGNFAVAIYELLAFKVAGWWRNAANTVAYIALGFLPPLLAHAHFKLIEWFDPRTANSWFGRWLKPLAWLGYTPLVVIPYAVAKLWEEPYAQPMEKLGLLLLPFIGWFVFIFLECAVMDWRLSQVWQTARERQFFRIFAVTMLASAVLFTLTYVLGARLWRGVGLYLDLFAKLSSIVPTAIVAWYIYRYRYFELILRQSVIYAALAAVVMMTYIYGIRRLSLALEARYDLRSEVIEALLILVVFAVAEPVRRATEYYLRKLFTREVGLYRELVAQVGAASANLGKLQPFIAFAENHLRTALELKEVKIVPIIQASADELELCRFAEARQLTQIEDPNWLARLDAVALYALWREARVVGLLVIRDKERQLTAEKREVLTVLTGHLAAAIENCQLLEEKVALERELAASERMASLGQMAATVAHEVKNPLSAIKSIAQVMREDEAVAAEYGRDLDLITGEVDRLNRSVSQLLSFSRPSAIVAAPAALSEVAASVVSLVQSEAAARGVQCKLDLQCNPQLDGATVTALKEVLLNLTLNGVQAMRQPGLVAIASQQLDDMRWQLSVSDEGDGIPPAQQSKIFEPFFTTKQRGTGLGLAIVARRISELGGTIQCVSPLLNERGTRFVMALPVAATPVLK
jgi:signal transduction histidine kinase